MRGICSEFHIYNMFFLLNFYLLVLDEQAE
jgi:hypothetical protein